MTMVDVTNAGYSFKRVDEVPSRKKRSTATRELMRELAQVNVGETLCIEIDSEASTEVRKITRGRLMGSLTTAINNLEGDFTRKGVDGNLYVTRLSSDGFKEKSNSVIQDVLRDGNVVMTKQSMLYIRKSIRDVYSMTQNRNISIKLIQERAAIWKVTPGVVLEGIRMLEKERSISVLDSDKIKYHLKE